MKAAYRLEYAERRERLIDGRYQNATDQSFEDHVKAIERAGEK